MNTSRFDLVSSLSRAALSGLLLTLLATGCASYEDIPLSDDSAIRAKTSATALPASTAFRLQKADEQGIELAVFSDLLERPLKDDSACTGVFLQAEDAQVEALIKKYTQHVPPVKSSAQIDLQLPQQPRDKATGKPAMMLIVEINKPTSDQSVSAIGRWFSGGAVSGFYAYILQKTNGEWRVTNVQ